MLLIDADNDTDDDVAAAAACLLDVSRQRDATVCEEGWMQTWRT